MKKFQFTKAGFDKIKSEYEELKNKKQPYAIDRLQKARAMGDLSENSEYHAAKEDLAFVEGRLRELEELLSKAEVIKDHNTNGAIELGCQIVLEKNGVKEKLLMVGEFEADPLKKKLSHTSPLGKALIGRRIGEVFDIDVPAGKMRCKILDIKKEASS